MISFRNHVYVGNIFRGNDYAFFKKSNQMHPLKKPVRLATISCLDYCIGQFILSFFLLIFLIFTPEQNWYWRQLHKNVLCNDEHYNKEDRF